MSRYVVAALVVLMLSSCAGGDGAPPQTVPGTEAWANDERVGPLYEGQYVGQLEVVDGGACRGNSGSESTGSTKVTLRIDDRCRVYVEALEH